MPELSQEEFLERIAYVRFAFRARKAEVDSARLGEALITTFQEGYSGNHQPYPARSLTLHRGRIASGGEPLPRLSDHWYPPVQFAGYSRASLPGESVFYCSSGNGTSLLELRPKLGSVVSMIECPIEKDPLRLKWIETSDTVGMQKGDGIAYESVATDLRGVNLALKGSIADQSVEPLSFRAYRVCAVTTDFDFRVACVASAGPPKESGTISWVPVTSCQGHAVNWSLYDRPEPAAVAASCGEDAEHRVSSLRASLLVLHWTVARRAIIGWG